MLICLEIYIIYIISILSFADHDHIFYIRCQYQSESFISVNPYMEENLPQNHFFWAYTLAQMALFLCRLNDLRIFSQFTARCASNHMCGVLLMFNECMTSAFQFVLVLALQLEIIISWSRGAPIDQQADGSAPIFLILRAHDWLISFTELVYLCKALKITCCQCSKFIKKNFQKFLVFLGY